MKTGFIIIAILSCSTLVAQPVKKVYAYSQHFTRGMVPERNFDDERSGKTGQQAQTIEYFIYLAVSPNDTIAQERIRIKGTWYSILRSEIVPSPVVIEQPRKRTLVPATRNKLLRVQIGAPLASQTVSLPKSLKSSEVVIPYINKGKTYYAFQNKISILEPVAGL